MQSKIEPVIVFVRLRPEEGSIATAVSAGNDGKTVRITPPEHCYNDMKNMYSFDQVFHEGTSQEEIYYSVSERVLSCLQGFSTAIITYGATESGKSHTMIGSKQAAGIIPRAIQDIFQQVEQMEASVDIHMSYVEVSNNNFRNLLETVENENDQSTNISRKIFTTRANHKIEVREHPLFGTYLSGPKNLQGSVKSSAEAFELLSRAHGNCQDHANRSHTILTLSVESRGNDSEEVNIGKIHFVDLAGTERLAKDNTVARERNISSSLAALNDVLAVLAKNISSNKTPQRVPYRNSKLTYLLKDCFGGNSKTTLIAHLRSAKGFYTQTVHTLMTASQAKQIWNAPVVNRKPAKSEFLGTPAEERRYSDLRRMISSELQRFQNKQVGKVNKEESLLLRQMQSELEKAILRRKSLQAYLSEAADRKALENNTSVAESEKTISRSVQFISSSERTVLHVIHEEEEFEELEEPDEPLFPAEVEGTHDMECDFVAEEKLFSEESEEGQLSSLVDEVLNQSMVASQEEDGEDEDEQSVQADSLDLLEVDIQDKAFEIVPEDEREEQGHPLEEQGEEESDSFLDEIETYSVSKSASSAMTATFSSNTDMELSSNADDLEEEEEEEQQEEITEVQSLQSSSSSSSSFVNVRTALEVNKASTENKASVEVRTASSVGLKETQSWQEKKKLDMEEIDNYFCNKTHFEIVQEMCVNLLPLCQEEKEGEITATEVALPSSLLEAQMQLESVHINIYDYIAKRYEFVFDNTQDLKQRCETLKKCTDKNYLGAGLGYYPMDAAKSEGLKDLLRSLYRPNHHGNNDRKKINRKNRKMAKM